MKRKKQNPEYNEGYCRPYFLVLNNTNMKQTNLDYIVPKSTAIIALFLCYIITCCSSSRIHWNLSFPHTTAFGDPCLGFGNGTELLAIYGVESSQPHPQQSQPPLTTFYVFVADSGTLLWKKPLPAVAIPQYSGWCSFGTYLDAINQLPLFVGTDVGVMAFDALSSNELWYYKSQTTYETAPAHPTYAGGFVYVTHENGHASAAMTILRSDTGEQVFQTEEVAFTLIWNIAAVNSVAYCGYSPLTKQISVYSRFYNGTLNWQLGNLSYSPPGLWDNPNLDVDAEGKRVFMYSKPNKGLRTITSIDSSTGRIFWVVSNEGNITDYDTYAWDGDFFRLMTTNATTMRVERMDGVTGELKWRTQFPQWDPNAILLVGSGGVYVFGLSSSLVSAFSAMSGVSLWSMSIVNPTTGITGKVGPDRFSYLWLGLENGLLALAAL